MREILNVNWITNLFTARKQWDQVAASGRFFVEAVKSAKQRNDATAVAAACAAAFSDFDQKDKVIANLKARWLLGCCFSDVGAEYRELGLRNEAETAYRRGIAVLGPLVSNSRYAHKARSQIAACNNQLGLLYMDTGSLEESGAFFAEAIRIRYELCRTCPQDNENKVYLAGALCNWGNLALQQKRNVEAAAFYQDSVKLLDEAIPRCDCGCRDGIAHALSAAQGFLHWIVLAQQFRRNAQAGLAALGNYPADPSGLTTTTP